jgi:Protein of unknown function (DUF998)
VLKNIFLITLFFIACQTGVSQYKLPILLSDSGSVNIKVDGNILAIWNIDPDTKPWVEPDVFAIERSFRDRKVTYLSNRDSISFILKPGEKFDFTIVIKNRGAFPMRLTTYGQPEFLHARLLISIFLGIIILVWFTWSKRKSFRPIPLLYLGILTPLLFWVATITGGYLHGNYNHLHDVVSELGAIGTRSEIFMSTAELLISILSVFSVIGFYKATKQIGISVIPVLTILSLSLSMFWAAIFPMHHELHGTLGPLPLFLNAGALLSLILWKGKKLLTLRLLSLVSFLFMALITLRFIPNLRGNWEGLIQRSFYLGWSVWSIALSLIFIQKLEPQNRHISSAFL